METDTPQRSFSLQTFLIEVRQRKVRQRLTIYLSAALTILGVVELFSNEYKLPRALFDLTLITLLCGIPCAFTSAWIHGSQGAQRIRWREVGVYVAFAAIATGIVLRTGGTLPRGMIAKEGKSIAVLPFINLSDSKDDEYFSDGVTEDILTQLSKIADLKVISRTSSMHFKNTKKSIREIAGDLEVAYVLEGSVRRAGGRVRIVGQLIEARTDEHVWSETYDRDAQDVFAIQSEVARTIAHELQAALSPEELGRIEKKNTTNLDAYGFYLRGRDYYYRYTKEDNERAIEMFRSALQSDPRYALAYAGVGDAYGMRATRYRLGREWADSAVAVSTRAISLDPGLAEGYKALGLALDIKGQPHEALTQYYHAVELNPNYAPVLGNIGSVEFMLGHYDVALSWVKKAAALQPESAQFHTLVGLQYESMGFDSAAGVWLDRAMALQPDMMFAGILRCYSDFYAGRGEQAQDRIAHLLAARPDEYGLLETAGDLALIANRFGEAASFFRRATEVVGLESPVGAKLAFALEKTGKRKESDLIVANIVRSFDTPGAEYPEGSQIPLMLAQVYAMRRDLHNSAAWLARGVDKGYRDYRWTITDPILAPIRADRDGAAVIERIKTEFDAMRQRVLAKGIGEK